MSKTGQYLCLSYCCGNLTHALKSTTSNIFEWKGGIPWVIIPKTFQDAVTFTRRLGQRYIRIIPCALYKITQRIGIENLLKWLPSIGTLNLRCL